MTKALSLFLLAAKKMAIIVSLSCCFGRTAQFRLPLVLQAQPLHARLRLVSDIDNFGFGLTILN